MKYSYFFLALNFCTLSFIKGNAETKTLTRAIQNEYKMRNETQKSSFVATDFGTIEKIKEGNHTILQTRIITNLDELQREPNYNFTAKNNIKERILNNVKENIGNNIDYYTKITEVKRTSEYDHGVEIVCKTYYKN